MTCINCGKDNSPDARFCNACGHRLDARGGITTGPAAPGGAGRSAWRWLWLAFLIFAVAIELLAKDDSVRGKIEGFNAQLYTAASQLSIFGVGRSFFDYLYHGERGELCRSDLKVQPSPAPPSSELFLPRLPPEPELNQGPLEYVCVCSRGSDRRVSPGKCWWLSELPGRLERTPLGPLVFAFRKAFSEGWLSAILAVLAFLSGLATAAVLSEAAASAKPPSQQGGGWPFALVLLAATLLAGLYTVLLQLFILGATTLFGGILKVSALPAAVAGILLIKTIGNFIKDSRARAPEAGSK